MLELAKKICMEAHKEQADKGGEPYYLHPFHVASNCKTEKQKIVALLHDVVEDNDRYSFDYFSELGFSPDIVEALDAITHRKDENYEEYIERVKANELARVVKIQDLRHNLDLTRLKVITEKDLARVKKYKHCLKSLNSPKLCGQYKNTPLWCKY